MNELYLKIEQLVRISNIEAGGGYDDLRNKIDQQDNLIKEIKLLARANKTILGRIIKFQKADSYAMYVITNVNKSSVSLLWLDYCDGWIDDRCGKNSPIDIQIALQQIEFEDYMDSLLKQLSVEF